MVAGSKQRKKVYIAGKDKLLIAVSYGQIECIELYLFTTGQHNKTQLITYHAKTYNVLRTTYNLQRTKHPYIATKMARVAQWLLKVLKPYFFIQAYSITQLGHSFKVYGGITHFSRFFNAVFN